jgi:hypothetical protein
MNGRQDDPRDLPGMPDTDPVAEELERYTHATRAVPPADLADRVMAAIEQAPAPRRGFVAGIAAIVSGRAPGHRWAQVGVMAATLVLAVGGIIAAGELARLVRDGTNVGTSPSPVVQTQSPSLQPSLTPTPTPTSSPTPTASPEASESEGEPSETPESSAGATQPPVMTPSPSEDDEHSSSPQPTASPRSSDESHSGSG